MADVGEELGLHSLDLALASHVTQHEHAAAELSLAAPEAACGKGDGHLGAVLVDHEGGLGPRAGSRTRQADRDVLALVGDELDDPVGGPAQGVGRRHPDELFGRTVERCQAAAAVHRDQGLAHPCHHCLEPVAELGLVLGRLPQLVGQRLDGGRHRVERVTEHADLVLALHGRSHAEVTPLDPLGRFGEPSEAGADAVTDRERHHQGQESGSQGHEEQRPEQRLAGVVDRRGRLGGEDGQHGRVGHQHRSGGDEEARPGRGVGPGVTEHAASQVTDRAGRRRPVAELRELSAPPDQGEVQLGLVESPHREVAVVELGRRDHGAHLPAALAGVHRHRHHTDGQGLRARDLHGHALLAVFQRLGDRRRSGQEGGAGEVDVERGRHPTLASDIDEGAGGEQRAGDAAEVAFDGRVVGGPVVQADEGVGAGAAEAQGEDLGALDGVALGGVELVDLDVGAGVHPLHRFVAHVGGNDVGEGDGDGQDHHQHGAGGAGHDPGRNRPSTRREQDGAHAEGAAGPHPAGGVAGTGEVDGLGGGHEEEPHPQRLAEHGILAPDDRARDHQDDAGQTDGGDDAALVGSHEERAVQEGGGGDGGEAGRDHGAGPRAGAQEGRTETDEGGAGDGDEERRELDGEAQLDGRARHGYLLTYSSTRAWV